MWQGKYGKGLSKLSLVDVCSRGVEPCPRQLRALGSVCSAATGVALYLSVFGWVKRLCGYRERIMDGSGDFVAVQARVWVQRKACSWARGSQLSQRGPFGERLAAGLGSSLLKNVGDSRAKEAHVQRSLQLGQGLQGRKEGDQGPRVR